MTDKSRYNLSILSEGRLFSGMSKAEIDEALNEFKAKIVKYDKDVMIFHAGSKINRMGLVLSGSVTVESNDLWGNRTILTIVKQGGLFAETYALLGETLLVDVVANESSEILLLKNEILNNFIEIEKSWQGKLLLNLLTVSAQKNLTLAARSFDTAPKSIRGRVMSYLNAISLKEHSRSFEIPFDRQQLADYLNVERTALSKELGKMKKENLINFRKNYFELF